MTHHSWKPYDLSNSKQDPRSGTWTSCRPSPRCSWRGTPSPPWSSRSGPWFSCKAVLCPLFRKAPRKIVHRASGRSNGIETKTQTFRYRSLLSEQNQNVLIWSAFYRIKSRTFYSVPKWFRIESGRFGDFLSLKTKPERNRINLLSNRKVSIYLGFRGNKTELLGTISYFFFYQFGTFLFVPS